MESKPTIFLAAILGSYMAPGACAAALAAPSVNVVPSGATVDAPFIARVDGAPPGETVTIRATRRTEEGKTWTATGTFVANKAGIVDASVAPSIGGTYVGVSPHGLLCSALPVPAEELGTYIAGFATNPRQETSFPDPLGRMTIEVSAWIDGQIAASTSAWRSYVEGTSGEEVGDPASGWKGVFFPPAPGMERGLPVLILPGSGGGLFRYRAALMASHGHPTLALAMYRYPGLPDSLVNYPVERVRDAALWLGHRAKTGRAVVMGISRGSEAAALAAIHFPEAFSGIVLLVPSHLSDAGALGPAAAKGDSAWSVKGEPTAVTDLGFSPDDPRVVEQAKTLPGYNASAMVRDKWGSREFEAKYGIPFERMKAPVLVLVAGEDAVWPSGISAQKIADRFAKHGKADQVEVHVYEKAGHGMVEIGSGTIMSTFGYSPHLKGFIAKGGEPNANCEASFDNVEAMFAFLRRLERRSRSTP